MSLPAGADRPDDETKFAPKAPGSFARPPNNLQEWIVPGGKFAPAPGLQKVVGLSHTGIKTKGKRGTDEYVGWHIPEDPTGNGFTSAYEIYNKGRDYGRKQLTTPMLFDKETKQVVSNDPAQILLMLNGTFNEWAENKIDLYPEELMADIERVNDVVFPGVNDGVYRCWFGPTDEAYQEGFDGIQSAFKWVEARLQSSEYLCGDRLTLADVRAFPHFFRFDVIYHKLMLRDPRGAYLKDANPAIVLWLKRLFREPLIQEVCDLQVATRFYLSEPDQECDDLYTALKDSWMPSVEELEAKRNKEKLPSSAAGKSAL